MKKFKNIVRSVASAVCVFSLLGTSMVPWASAIADEEGPLIEHTPLEEVVEGQAFKIEARVTDESGVNGVWLHYKQAGSDNEWKNNAMEEDVSGLYVYRFDGGSLVPPSLDYYIQAEDSSANKNQEQDGFEFEPYRLSVQPSTQLALQESQPKGSRNTVAIVLGAVGAVALIALVAGSGSDDSTTITSPIVFR